MGNTKRSAQLVCLAALGFVSPNASAEAAASEDAYAYVGGGPGYERMNGEDFTNTDGDLTKNRVSWKAMAGTKLGKLLALEGQYIDFGAANRNTDRIQATGWTAGIVLDLLVNQQLTPYAKVGALFWDTDSTFNSISRREEGTDLAYGLGLRLMIADQFSLRTEYEWFVMDYAEIENFSFSLQLNF